ncbi:Lipase 2 [Lasiodiplodia hormozganensis]|uniref:Lipase 2 n=1 Tax=Lasiodiplodia hormozganensis TaxID=869390 RepID=A0AA39YV52_9PEZI|nr:Lipase 2 [Lasiodiplodia hormozganensis]
MNLPSGKALIDMFIAKTATKKANWTPTPDTPTEHTILIPMRDGHLNPARVHRPPPSTTTTIPSPLVVFIHGGGFCAGDHEQFSPTARTLAHLFGATVATISHRLAPAHPFPFAALDALDAARWLATHARDIGADPFNAGFVIAGVSSGASLAGVVAQKLLDEEDAALPGVTGVWMQMPGFLDPAIVPERWKHLHFAREQNRDAPVINGEAMAYLDELYAPDVRSDLFSPVNAEGFGKKEKKLPPHYIMVCGMDPARDDGLVYEKMLREAGVETRIDVFPGIPHGPVIFAATGLPAAKEEVINGIHAFGWLFGKKVSDEDIQKAL